MNKIVKELRALIQPHGVISLASPDLFEEAAAQIELQHAALHSLFCAVCMNFPDWMIEAKELGDEVRHALGIEVRLPWSITTIRLYRPR